MGLRPLVVEKSLILREPPRIRQEFERGAKSIFEKAFHTVYKFLIISFIPGGPKRPSSTPPAPSPGV
jgi:hypothetical protein